MDIDTRDGLGIPALWYAVCGGHLPVVQDLIEKHNANFDDKCSFLRAAIVCKRLPVARYLLTKGATVEQNMCILLPAWSVINNTPDSNLAIAKFLIEEVNIDHCSKDEIRRMLLTQAKSLLQKDVILYLQELTFADPSEN